jgi:hypothetical protein
LPCYPALNCASQSQPKSGKLLGSRNNTAHCFRAKL